MKIYDNQHLEQILQDGGVMLCPTDTIRGLSCDASQQEAVEKIFEIKQRPKEKSVIVLMASEEMLAEYGVVLTDVQKYFLASAIKPTTMILDGVKGLAPSVYHENGSVGVRIVRDNPENAGAHWCHAFLSAYGKPIVSTSANVSGEPSPRLFPEIVQEIRDAVDGYPDPQITQIPGESSQIVRIDTDGQVTILRA